MSGGLIFIHICTRCNETMKKDSFGTYTTYYHDNPDPTGRCDLCGGSIPLMKSITHTYYYKKKDLLELLNEVHTRLLWARTIEKSNKIQE